MSFPVCNKHHQLTPETSNSARDRLEYRVHGWKFLKKEGTKCMLGSFYEQMGSFEDEGPHGRQRKAQNLGQVREVQKVQRVKEGTVFS